MSRGAKGLRVAVSLFSCCSKFGADIGVWRCQIGGNVGLDIALQTHKKMMKVARAPSRPLHSLCILPRIRCAMLSPSQSLRNVPNTRCAISQR
eukprot:2470312-Rhodomonas_salina.1